MYKEDLNACLKRFNTSAEKQDGLFNKSSSLKAIRATIDRYLKTTTVRQGTLNQSPATSQTIQSKVTDRPSLDQQKKMSEALSFFLHSHEATSAKQENTAGRQLDIQATSPSTTAIQASPASVLIQHNQVAVSNNMENFAHGEQGLHCFPPLFNFHHYTNVQIHNNFSRRD